MGKLRLLVLTDHRVHTAENSLYELLRAMQAHSLCEAIFVASRGVSLNSPFFNGEFDKPLIVSKIDSNFHWRKDGLYFLENQQNEILPHYDAVLLRLPHPVPVDFWKRLAVAFPSTLFINQPAGIEKTGSKAFLLNFPELCPPMILCNTANEIHDWQSRFPVVLKPLRSYGGKGIVKIENGAVEGTDGKIIPLDSFLRTFEKSKTPYLGVQYLKGVTQGDKRIVVCDGKILGAAIRFPQPGSWVCNVAMGGKATGARPDADEIAIISQIQPALEQLGVVFYGIDTLVNDGGKRVLSEINTLSIGGLPKLTSCCDRPVIQKTATILWNYIAVHISQTQ